MFRARIILPAVWTDTLTRSVSEESDLANASG
jgi:hypothetical protein